MTCERYWREGVLLVEQGRPDPHREGCLDCRREHEARAELVRAFRLVATERGDTRWQARVWRRIALEERPKRTWLPWSGAVVAAAAMAVLTVVLLVPRSGPVEDIRPRHEIDDGAVARRSGSRSPSIGDRVRFYVASDQEARIYRAEVLLLRCTPSRALVTAGCSRDARGILAELELALGEYQLVSAPANLAEPTEEPALQRPTPQPRTLDADLAALTNAGGTYQLRSFNVR